MKFFHLTVFALVLFAAASAQAMAPSPNLEEKIAYQQGQFGALYARCGSPDEKAVIGGSLANWRMETFRGYQGKPEERAQLEKAFDTAVAMIATTPDVCRDWIMQASVTWHSIAQLAQYGEPVVLKQ
jgi:hypothetical protein